MLTTAAAAAEASEQSGVADCMDLAQNLTEGGIEYHLTNNCKKSVSCSVAWTLTCGEKSQQQSYHRSVSLWLKPSADGSATANVRECKGESWEVSGVSWACSPQ